MTLRQEAAQKAVDLWNKEVPVGTLVMVKDHWEGKTISQATTLSYSTLPVVLVEGFDRYFELKNLTPVL